MNIYGREYTSIQDALDDFKGDYKNLIGVLFLKITELELELNFAAGAIAGSQGFKDMTPKDVLKWIQEGVASVEVCPVCNSEDYKKEQINYEFPNKKGETFTVPDLLVEKCGHCGEVVLDAEACKRVDYAWEQSNIEPDEK